MIIFHVVCLILLTDNDGVTPLLAAAYQDKLKCAAILLKANCRLNPVGEVKIDHVYRSVSPLQCAVVRGHFAVARLLVEAGACARSERYLYDGENVPPKLVEDCDFWLWLVSQVSNPMSLFDLCVLRIRDCMGLRLCSQLDQLPLPPFVRRCLLMEDVIDPYLQGQTLEVGANSASPGVEP